MAIPSWADAKESAILSGIRAGGEGQNVEFIADFSEQAREIAKEVAAFATSGGGKILFGVNDDGTISGLDHDEHDKTVHRLQGIIGQVQPRVKAEIKLCFDEGFVIVIEVAKDQEKPIYCCEYRVYVRDLRTSRPGTPEEIIERVCSHPSLEHKRRMEDLRYQSMKRYLERSDKRQADFQETSAEMRRAFISKRD